MSEKEQRTEEAVVSILTNDPSAPVQIPDYPVKVTFQRPKLTDKFKGRNWANKKLKEIGVDLDDPGDTTAFFFRYWGSLNSFVKSVLVEDENGDIKSEGKTYRAYEFDPHIDVDYSSVFEKYVIEEIYNKGGNEEAFVSNAIVAHAQWVTGEELPEEDDVKNS